MEGLEEVDLVVELYEETMEFLGEEVCEGRGAGSESEPDEEDIVRSFPKILCKFWSSARAW